MSSLRLPVRLLGSVNAASAYPRELLADFTTGDLLLINTTGGQVSIPNAITVKTSGSGNAITGISANGKTLTLTKGSTFLTAHPTITKSTDGSDSLNAAFGGKFSVIDSITRDSNGHVTKINTKSITLPSAPTSVSGAAGSAAEFTAEQEITLTGDITGSKSSKAGWSIETALKSLYETAPGAVGPTANASPAHSGTFTVPQVTVDKAGRVTAITARTITLPAAPTSVSGNAGTATKFATAQSVALTGDVTGTASSQAGWSVATTLKELFTTAPGAVGPTANSSPAHGGTITVPQVTVDKAGRVTAITARTITLPSVPSSVSGNAGTATKFASAQDVTLTGDVTGTASSQAGWSIETTLAALFDTAPGAVGPTAAATLAFGGSVNIPQVTVDTKGRVTSIIARAIKLPSAPTSVSGNAGTATKFASAQKVALTGDVTGSASSQAGWSVTATLASLYETAPGAVGPGTNDSTTPAHGGTIKIPVLTIDTKGRVTAASTKTITLPSAPTSVSGNAGTATKFASAQSVALTGDITGSASSQAGWSIATTLKSLFSTAPGAIGPTAAATLTYGGTFNVPQVTVDKTGRVTAITSRTLTMPAAPTPSLSVSSSGSGDFVKSISASGSTISYVKGSAASTVTYKVNIGTTWSGSAAPYTQTITVSGMLATDNPIVDVTPDSTYDTAVSQVEAWGNIHRITTAANSITVYANDKTEVAIPIQLKCIRG